ncbi:hypothetical protein ACIO3O_37100 [Streptomyces sp. NPDC087440]|uniref:hypothetical protein n=1 Tax=Streptomyces sp. NPDC087440 TaxID=3365790 RepID=UPI003809518B
MTEHATPTPGNPQHGALPAGPAIDFTCPNLGTSEVSPAPPPVSVLPPQELEVYLRVRRRELIPSGTPGLEGLLRRGLIASNPLVGEDSFVPVGRMDAERRLREPVEAALMDQAQKLKAIYGFFDELDPEDHWGGQPVGGKEFISADQANSRISASTETAKFQLVAAQPGVRTQKTLEVSRARDRAIVERGVSMRTIYHSSARANRHIQSRARDMLPLGAEISTLPGRFIRIIGIDRDEVFVNDFVERRETLAGAWHFTDPVVVAFVLELFEHYWAQAVPWHLTNAGLSTLPADVQEHILKRYRAGDTQQDIVAATGVAAQEVFKSLVSAGTFDHQRSILQGYQRGLLDQRQIGVELKMAARTVIRHLNALKNFIGLKTTSQLLIWYGGPGMALLQAEPRTDSAE